MHRGASGVIRPSGDSIAGLNPIPPVPILPDFQEARFRAARLRAADWGHSGSTEGLRRASMVAPTIWSLSRSTSDF